MKARGIFAYRRLIVTTAVLWVLAGILAWRTMPRQEDPDMPNAWGMILAPFPGADSETVERLVVDPIEEKLLETPDIKLVKSVSRSDIGIINVELSDDAEPEAAWDEIRRALEETVAVLPKEASPPTLNEHLNRQESVVTVLTGSDDRLLLKERVDALKRQLIGVPGVAEVRVIADPGEQITVAMEDAVMRRLGIDALSLVARLTEQNRLIPGGAVHVGDKQVSLRPGSDFASIDEIRDTPVRTASGAFVPLSTVATVTREPSAPTSATMIHNGQTAVGLGIVPKPKINLVAFGDRVRDAVERAASIYAPLKAEIVVNQPSQVENRISQLLNALIVSIAVVAIVLFLLMGGHLGLTVTAVIPMVVLAGLAVFGWMGGALHQISIAALIISLSMLVDNAIVVTERIQSRLDEGLSPESAANLTVKELFRPLAAATGTTLAAFVPMLLASGPTAKFTRAIPIVIMLTLTASFIFAMTVTPLLAQRLLRPRPKSGVNPATESRLSRRLGLSVRRPKTVATVAAAMVVLGLVGAGFVSKRFFPTSDRPLMVVKVELPEGAYLGNTARAVQRLSDALLKRPGVGTVTGFSGRSVPHFYYNLPQLISSPHLGQIVVQTDSVDRLGALQHWLDTDGRRLVPEAEVSASPLEQGPPVEAPVEIRLFSADLRRLQRATAQVRNLLEQSPGTKDVRHGLGMGAPIVDFDVHEETAGRLGILRSDVATALLRTTRGLPLGPLRSGEDPVPIVLRSTAGENTTPNALFGIDASSPGGKGAPLIQVAAPTVRWMPAALQHRNRERFTSVTAQLREGATFSTVARALTPKLEAAGLDAMGVRYEYGGDLEGAGQADAAMLSTLPIGLMLLLMILLAEFPSYRKVGIILVTVPLAAVGVVPGLLISGEPFGFMSLLGVFALVGIVVNNAIVLIDVIDRLREEEGVSVETAIRQGTLRRLRPILLTTATTVVGLVPLALSPTTLWPPLAWAMISGLSASTLLTLLVVPALYLLLYRRESKTPSVETQQVSHPNGAALQPS